MSYTITRTDREVTYERDLDDRIDMYLYFNKRGRHINGDHGIQPEHLLFELITFIESNMVSDAEGGPTQQAEALGAILFHLNQADDILYKFRKRESLANRMEYISGTK